MTETLCSRCARKGKTCCQDREIYVTLGDVQRIKDRMKILNFYEFREYADPAYLDEETDPVWVSSIFRPDGRRRLLKQDSAGNCVFLYEDGCALDPESRPLICRLHPFDFNASGIFSDLACGCPIELLSSGETLQQSLGLDNVKAAAWHRLLYSEILLEKKDYEYWTHIRFAV